MSGIPLEIQVSTCLADFDQQGWDDLSAGRAFASYQWYRFGERVMGQRTPLYIVASHAGEPVARATFWLIRDEPLPVQPAVVRCALQTYLRARPLLICRSPLADTGGLILPDPPLRRPALEAILAAAREYGHKVGASFLVCDYLDPQQAGLPDWPASWLAYRLDDPGTVLPVRWSCFSDYLDDLSKTAYKDFRRQRNHAERLGLTLTAKPCVDDGAEQLPGAGKLPLDEALPLIRAVEARHNAPPKPWARDLLARAAEGSTVWVEARVGTALAGCGLLLQDQGVYLATLLGLDYHYSYVYFQVMYAAIREVQERGARALRAGSGAYELKQRLGFEIEENNHLRFAGQNSLLNWAGLRLAG